MIARLVICLFLLQNFVQAQDTLGYRVIAKANRSDILLRWAPTSSRGWLFANKQGYIIEKILITKDGKILTNTRKQILSTSPLKPLPLDDWETIVKSDKFAPIAAQALYGDNFVLKTEKSSVLNMINASKEQENRYSFALFACDMSWKVAQSSALGFEDKSVLKGERYLYKIYPAPLPTTVKKKVIIDTAFVYIGLEDFQPIPRVTRLEGEFGDRMVVLRWNQAIYNQFFTAYEVERSEDGKTFTPTSDVPFLSPGDKVGDGMIYKTDSLAYNEKKYYFRVRGITPFGEKSQPSDTLVGEGHIPLSGNPAITESSSPDNKQVILRFTFPEKELSQVAGFEVERAERIEGIYQTISPKTLPVSQREYKDIPNKNSNYYRIKALGKKKGEYAYSFPVLAQLVDSIPPNAPIGLKGEIDSLGIVKISWKKGNEPDLYGYRVYRANSLKEEFSQITKEAIQRTYFTDTIQLQTLTKKVYYQIVAVDTRFNPSKFSEALEIKRPDKIAPNPAVFISAKSTLKGVELLWEKSGANDLEKQVIYRKEEREKDWVVVATLDNKSTTFTDETGEKGKLYSYTLVSVDDSKLESKPSRPVQARKLDSKERAPIEKLTATKNTENKQIILSWKYPENTQVEKFIIYKGKGEANVSQLSFVGAGIRTYTDEADLKVGNLYRYRIKAVYKDGTESMISEAVKVNW
jgi:fibronectin type 3 domain-containing protein